MRNRLYLLAVLGCVLALGSTTWSYDRPYVIHDENVSANVNQDDTKDDHPWGEDQSIGNPNTNPNTEVGVRQRPSAITRIDRFMFQSRMYFINMLTRWTNNVFSEIANQPGTTTGTVPTTNSTTVSDGVR